MGSSFLQHLLHLLCEEIVTQQYEVKFPSCTRIFFHLNWNGQSETKECIDIQRDMMAGRCGSRVYTIKDTENKGGQLKVGWTICFSLKWHTTMLKLHRNGGRITWTELNWPVCVCVCVCVCVWVCVCHYTLLFFITCRIISLVIASNTSNCLGLHSSFLFCFGKLRI